MTDKPSYEQLAQRVTDLERQADIHERALLALRETEERYRIAIEGSNDGVAIVKGDNHFYVNDKFVKIFGYDRAEEIIGKPVWGFVHPEDRERVAGFNRSRQQGHPTPSRYDCKGLRKDGSLIYLSVSASSTTHHGEPVSLVFLRDATEQKLAENNLRESEARYRNIFENIQDVYYEVSPDGTILEVSPSVEEVTGYPREEVLGRSLYGIYVDPEVRGQLMKELSAKGKVTDHEIIMTEKDGTQGYCSVTAKLVSDQAGNAQKIIGSLHDITERKRIEKALRESDAQKRAILEASLDRICYLDRNMKIIWVNRVAAAGLDISTEDMKGRVCHEVLIGRDAPCEGCPSEKALETGRPARALMHQTRMKGISGESFWDTYCVPVRNDADEVVNYLQVSRNVTEQKRTMDALQKSEETLRAILTASPVGICLVRDGKIVWANRALAAMLGYNEEAGLPWQSVRRIYPDDEEYDRVGRELYSAIRETAIGHIETKWIRKDGSILHCFVQASALDPSHPDKGIIGAAVDVTALKRAEEQIHSLSQELIRAHENERQMISRELHDRVAQDLSTLKVGLDILLDSRAEMPPQMHERLSGSSGILQEVITAVRDLSYDLRPPTLDQLGLVQTVYRYCEDFSEKTGIGVDFASAGMEQADLASEAEINLYRLIQEGLNNVRKHADAEQITVRLVASHPKIILRIEDDGKGFDVNAWLETRPNEKRMGIRSMKERVSLLGGKMDIRSRQGKGTRLLIEIPYEEKKIGSEEESTDH